ncbi:hypothetical protein Scep_010648 [Stephania cephalantha]|uniref:Uncharacterized protein n=1 Tax=Stephania cephalantha TaxID=152367 RepID=A0AAP0JVJ2_9MAGN
MKKHCNKNGPISTNMIRSVGYCMNKMQKDLIGITADLGMRVGQGNPHSPRGSPDGAKIPQATSPYEAGDEDNFIPTIEAGAGEVLPLSS